MYNQKKYIKDLLKIASLSIIFGEFSLEINKICILRYLGILHRLLARNMIMHTFLGQNEPFHAVLGAAGHHFLG